MSLEDYKPPRFQPGRLAVPARCSPIVRRFFEILIEERTTMTEVAARAGLRRSSISDWRYRRSPGLEAVRAALNVLGYDLAIVPRKDDGG